MAKSPITTHILDTALGRPAAGVTVKLHKGTKDSSGLEFSQIGEGVTNSDGRVVGLLSPEGFSAGMYRLDFETEPYFQQTGRETFFPLCQITFFVKEPTEHYHVPLLLSPFSYSTYRGS